MFEDMDAEDSENARPQSSSLRPPTKIPPISNRSLVEITDAETNARGPPSLPVPVGSLKHKLTGQSESAPKRKTLAERAGEPGQNYAAPPSSRPVNASVRATTLAGIRGGLSSAFGSSLAAPSQNMSRGTLASSVGHNSRGKPQLARPQSSLSSFRSTFQKTAEGPKKPTTSLQIHQGNDNADGKRQAWDHRRIESMDNQMKQVLNTLLETTSADKQERQEAWNLYKARISELEMIRTQLSTTNSDLQNEVDSLRSKVHEAEYALDEMRRKHNNYLEDEHRKHRSEIERLEEASRRELDYTKTQVLEETTRRSKEVEEDARRRLYIAEEEATKRLKALQDDVDMLERRLRTDVEDEKLQRTREVQDLTNQLASQRQNTDLSINEKDREVQKLKVDLSLVHADMDREKLLNDSLKTRLAEAASSKIILETSMEEMKRKITFLESDSQAQTQSYAEMNERMQRALEAAEAANAKLRIEETLRRKLHNQVQELKGNIRVFCRVRPALSEEEAQAAKISFPDCESDSKEVAVMGPEQKSALGNISRASHSFVYDRVFGPSSQNMEIFDEISQLVQSALDGYNVCIFCYGQTGSGKTYTMSSEDGMIPLAVNQIYDTAKGLEEKGWVYTMEGSFVEVYNEVLNDLLGKADEMDKKKHEIRHDNEACKTTITDVETVTLDSPSVVKSLLKRAMSNRSVAATKANERSSRSHSIFILKLIGKNSMTGEHSEGTLNLVDLAGSERIAHSGATGERLKETQNINKSLSCLGDVIGALGQGKDGAHVPYRNSKLTYLLQHSLGGNSKTLMFVMISPLEGHLSETLTSLRFATKVHSTHIGTAKRQAKVRD